MIRQIRHRRDYIAIMLAAYNGPYFNTQSRRKIIGALVSLGRGVRTSSSININAWGISVSWCFNQILTTQWNRPSRLDYVKPTKITMLICASRIICCVWCVPAKYASLASQHFFMIYYPISNLNANKLLVICICKMQLKSCLLTRLRDEAMRAAR